MENLQSADVVGLFVQLATLLAAARLLGEGMRMLRQPPVVGEILAGIVLGPTVLGHIAPGFQKALFPMEGPSWIAVDGIATVGVALLLFVAGLEIDLGAVRRLGRAAVGTGAMALAIPLTLGTALGWLAPGFFGAVTGAGHPPLTFALFFGVALSIAAMPVIAKTLIDLDLFRTDVGMVVMSAATFNDLVGWIAFSIVLGMMGGEAHGASSVWVTIALTLGFTAACMTLLRAAVHAVLPWIQSRMSWPGGVLGFVLVLALLASAATEAMGIHAMFGAFLAGVAVGDSVHFRERTRETIHQFVTNAFAPIFLAAIGLKVDILAHFDGPLVAAVFALACAGMIGGASLGARWGGFPPREALAIGLGMNSRGAMEIILGLLAFQAGLIRETMFVALLLMAVGTSVMSGPLMKRALGLGNRKQLMDLLRPALYVKDLGAVSPRRAIDVLAGLASKAAGLPPERIADEVWRREEEVGTGLGQGIALPHARIPGLKRPVLVVGRSAEGISFSSPDQAPSHLVLLLLSPADDPVGHLETVASLTRRLHDPATREAVHRAATFDELRAAFATAPEHGAVAKVAVS